jgi:PmbA protein
VLRSYLYDTATAAEYGGRSTASAVRSGGLDDRPYKVPPSVASRQVRVVSPRTTTDKLVASVDDGILVHDLMGVHTANVVSGDFGVTASLLFRVRDGEVGEALAPVSVSGNLHESLKRGLRLGDDVRHVDAGPGFELPTTLFGGFTVTP